MPDSDGEYVKAGRREQRAHRGLGVLLVGVVLALLLFGTATAQDLELGGKFRSGNEVVIPPDEVVEGDLYLFTGSARIEGTVRGDLVAFAGSVEVNGTVEGDLLAAGGQVLVAGEVAGDARASGGQLRVTGTVGEDLLAAGGQLSLSSRGVVGGDLIFASGNMSLAGDVAGSVLGTAGRYNNTGDIGGTEKVTVDTDEEEERTAVDVIADLIRGYIALLVVGLLLLLLTPRLVRAAEQRLRLRWPAALLAGPLGLIALVAALVVITLVGGLLAVLLGLAGFGSLAAAFVMLVFAAYVVAIVTLFILAGWVAPALVAVWLGDLLLRRRAGSKRWPLEALALGGILLAVLGIIPIAGVLVDAAVFLLGGGALLLLLWERRRRTPPVEG